MRAPCQAEMNAPAGSWNTAILPWSPTSNGAMTTVPPALLDARRERLDVVGPDVQIPRGGRVRVHLRADPGRVLAVDPCERVTPVQRVGVDLDVPPEQRRVERARRRGIRARQVHPRRLVRRVGHRLCHARASSSLSNHWRCIVAPPVSTPVMNGRVNRRDARRLLATRWLARPASAARCTSEGRRDGAFQWRARHRRTRRRVAEGHRRRSPPPSFHSAIAVPRAVTAEAHCRPACRSSILANSRESLDDQERERGDRAARAAEPAAHGMAVRRKRAPQESPCRATCRRSCGLRQDHPHADAFRLPAPLETIRCASRRRRSIVPVSPWGSTARS